MTERMRLDAAAFQGRAVSALFLDVRGTVLSAYEDCPVIPELRSLLGECAERGILVHLASATSLKSTGRGFVLEPLLEEFRARGVGNEYVSNCIAYIESGTTAYRMTLTGEDIIAPLDEFPPLVFSDYQCDHLAAIIDVGFARHGRDDVEKHPKPGQINCYAERPWPVRRQIADDINSLFAEHGNGMESLIAQVPSARETIDVALCTKSRIGADYLARAGASAESIMVVGDSLQAGGNDEPLWRSMPGSIGVQVGEMEPAQGVLHAAAMGPYGVIEAIQAALAAG